MSGLPGICFKCRRYPLSFAEDSILRTKSSGFVFFAHIALMVRETLSSLGTGARPSRI